MDDLILIGAGGHARSCIDVIELSGLYKISGIVEKNKNKSLKYIDYSILGDDNDLIKLRQKYNNALITVGQIKSPAIRINLFNLLNKLNYSLPIISSPISYISKRTKIGAGTIVMHNTIVNANSIIGKNCIINNSSLIEHDAIIGDHCHISTGAIINGEVVVGRGSFIGSGVITKQSITIGRNCIIGAGVVLKNDVTSNQVIAS